MPINPIARAILEEAFEKANEPYGMGRRIKGYFRNAFRGGVRGMFGGSSDAKSIAKVLGRNAVSQAPKALGYGAKQIPVIGSIAGSIVETGGNVIAKQVCNNLDDDRRKELAGKSENGTLTVAEMTEMIQKSGDVDITNADIFNKMRDAVRKVDEAYTAARIAIPQAKDCASIYKAAKCYAYLKYRTVKLQTYIEVIEAYLKTVSEMNERYGAQIIGWENDFVEDLSSFFDSVGPEYHEANCKDVKHCYYKSHGML